MAIPRMDQVHLADIDWSPMSAFETQRTNAQGPGKSSFDPLADISGPMLSLEKSLPNVPRSRYHASASRWRLQ
jgi:hypothetical protein